MELLVLGMLISGIVFVPIGGAIYRGNRRWLVEGRREGRRATRAAIVVLSVTEQAIVNLLGFGFLYYVFWLMLGREPVVAVFLLLFGVPLALVSTAVNVVLASVFVARRRWD